MILKKFREQMMKLFAYTNPQNLDSILTNGYLSASKQENPGV